MRTHWILVALTAAGMLHAAPVVEIYQTSFESEEGYEAGGAPGWQGEGGASAEEAAVGGQSLKVTGEATLIYPAWTPGKRIAYVDFQLKATADDSDEPAVTIEADGAGLAFLKDGESGVLYANDGAEESVSLSSTHATDPSGRSAEWIRVTLRIDYASGTYDVFVDGAPTAIDLKFDPSSQQTEPRKFTIRGIEDGESYLDDFRLTATNPLYADRDDDGLPDAYEEANGLNPNVNDRLGDRNGDGVSNIATFLGGRNAGAPAPIPGAAESRIVYVHAATGNDENDGRQCYRAGGSGPKATVQAAKAAARPGDTVVIMEGTYREGGIQLTGSTINFKFIGHVKIQ